jgi:hypothetical protein
MSDELSTLVAEAARQKLNLADAELRDEHFYANLPLCIIDAVYSIGVKYEGTRRTAIRWAKAQRPEWPMDRRTSSHEHTVTDFIGAMSPFTDDQLANDIFENRQRTSTKSGILKALAVREFAIALQKAGINCFADMDDVPKLEMAEGLVRKNTGQSSGISFDYFSLLAGKQLVKADRMIVRFVEDAGGSAVNPNVAKDAVIGAAKILCKEFSKVDARLLDSEIWGYESKKAASKSRKKERPTRRGLTRSRAL